ncbi:MAG: rRNA maturation RNase YbeY [Anaerolineae bacterium]|nr:rRNA maturation RNase YbeY [Anaerolineales bacterium]MCQ3975761.1 rRNA maturation RNase YbeY [Anaerolineae bacterium]
MDIFFQIDEPFQALVEPEPLEKAVQLTLRFLGNSYASSINSVTIVITDSDTVQQINAQYRGIDAPTDVLSFENTPDPDFPELDETEAGHLGDIIIAYPVAAAQAAAAGHTAQNEVILLAVHGLLHLLGFDHDTPENKEKMWQTQRQIMVELGLGHVQPTES